MAKIGFNVNTKNTRNVGNTSITGNTSVTAGFDYTSKYGNYSRYGYNYARTYETPKTGAIDTDLVSVLFDQETLDTIMRKCLPKAGGSEFQFHYRALQVKLTNQKGERVIFTFPTVFFNFPQKVSGGSVDFNLVEVEERSEIVKDMSVELAQQIMTIFPTDIFQSMGFDVKFVEGEIGSIHRHPGRFGFSATDLRNNPLNPGVIFRVKEATDLHQVDSVLFCGQEAELFTTEARLFNTKQVDPNDEDKGATGTVDTCPTLCYIKQDKPIVTPKNRFVNFFDDEAEDEPSSFLINKFRIDSEIDEIEEIMDLVSESYTPVDVVDPNLIEQRHYGYTGGRYGSYYDTLYGQKTHKTKASYSKESSKSAIDEWDEVFATNESLLFETPKTNLVGVKEDEFIDELKELLMLNSKYDFDEAALMDLEYYEPELKEIYNKFKSKKNKLQIEIGTCKVKMNSNGYKIIINGTELVKKSWDEIEDIPKENIIDITNEVDTSDDGAPISKRLGNKEFVEFINCISNSDYKKAFNLFEVWKKEYDVPMIEIESNDNWVYIDEDGVTIETSDGNELEIDWFDVLADIKK